MEQATRRFAGIVTLLLTAWHAAGQNAHGPAAICWSANGLSLSWSGVATLQSSTSPDGPWQDILEAGSPFGISPTNAQRFFRVTSRWDMRANLIEPNSEMGVAELGGKIHVMGGYPASRVTVNTVQVHDSVSNTWQTLPNLPTQRNHLAACAIDGRIYVVGGRLQAGFTSAMTNIPKGWIHLPGGGTATGGSSGSTIH